MNTKLASTKQFAILDDEQENEVSQKAKNIEVTKEEVKKNSSATMGFGLFKAIKTIFVGDKENEKKLKELNEQYKKDLANIDTNKPLTQEQIEEAKKDKQLIQNIVEKIDIASQEYAEDVELATSGVTIIATGVGAALGGLTKLISNKIKIPAGKSNIASIAVGFIVALAGSIWAMSLQKQASRVARYKVKQDFLKNPEKLAYVDDEVIKNEPAVKIQKNKKPGFFKFLAQIYQDNKEYKQYKKEHDVQQLKLSKAREEINLTPEQEKRAKQLQNNIFKMFNKVDEKSQTYSESTEALGEIVEYSGSLLAMIPGFIGQYKSINSKNTLGMIVSTLAIIFPALLLNAIVTREQKQASKVADMLAIKELDDYKHFADYSNTEDTFKKTEESKQETPKNELVEQVLKKRTENIQSNTQQAN